MNNTETIVEINSKEDVLKVNDKTKYIAISINSSDNDLVNYFFENGKSYLYTDMLDGKSSYIYANYDMFRMGEEVIDDIISGIDPSFTALEKVRYIYIFLGTRICSDINTIAEKNTSICFNDFALINNIWGVIVKKRATNISLVKLFMYICRKVNIKCDIVCGNMHGKYVNKIYLDNSYFLVDLYSDLYNIQSMFKTKYFGEYNDDKLLDKRIGYIKEEYNNTYIDKVLKKIDYTKEDIVYVVLTLTSKFLLVNKIGVWELGKIYTDIFRKYCPNYDIQINNFYVYDNSSEKEHFIVISYNNKAYGFNYRKKRFVEVNRTVLLENIKKSRIGIYENENFFVDEKEVIA